MEVVVTAHYKRQQHLKTHSGTQAIPHHILIRKRNFSTALKVTFDNIESAPNQAQTDPETTIRNQNKTQKTNTHIWII
jgi:hypothetical protein